MSLANKSDLSKFHHPVSDLFRRMNSELDVETYRLSDEQLRFFRDNGYLKGIRILSSDQIETLRTELSGFFEPDHDGRDLWHEYHENESNDLDSKLFHALGAWRLRPGFHDLLWNPVFLIPASQLIEGAVRFWHDQLFCKPAKNGGVVAWHQDYSYWSRTQPMAHLTCWIGLDESTVDNGCLHYVPGSHHWDLLPITGLAGDMDAIQNVLNDKQWKEFQSPIPIELAAGECCFHHPLMVHGSFANTTDRPRRAIVLNVVKDGVRSDTDNPLLDGIEIIPKGDPLGGQFFPMLFDPDSSCSNELN